VSPAHPSVQGRPRQTHFEADQGILQFIEQNTICYQDEIVDFLLTEYHICVYTEPQFAECCKDYNKSINTWSIYSPEASDIERALFRSKMTEYKANQIVFLDEPAANERTGDRRWGCRPLGYSAESRSKGKREGKGVLHVNVRKGITWPPFREGPVWDPRCQELGTLRIVVQT
jgi:hypothetical protein